jgi:multiple sugar transport system permease protein
MRARKRSRAVSEGLFSFALLAPAVVTIFVAVLIPLGYAFRDSLYRINISMLYQGEKFLGLGNYIQALRDPDFYNSLLVTTILTVSGVAIELVLGLLLALLLNRPLEGIRFMGKRVFRTLVILPVILPPVVVGLMWRFMFQYTGIINFILMSLGMKAVDWTTQVTGVITIIITVVWENIPFSFLLILAGLQSVPPDLVEGSMVDGASGAQRLFRIYLPLIRPIIFLILTIRTMDAFRTFDEAFILTGGGPGRSTETVSLFIYRNSFSFFDVGYGSALSILLLALLMIVTVFYMRAIYSVEGRGR